MGEDFDLATRVRGMEIRQTAQDDRIERALSMLEANTDALEKNTEATTKIAADFEVVRTWVESWTALSRVAEILGKWLKPILAGGAWASGIAAAYFGYKAANPTSKP